ncbi:MAG: Mpo1-like protein [Pseudomonadota bacterium]
MNASELIAWQWKTYARNHCSRSNLLLHIVVVPLFWIGNVMLVVALLRGAWLAALAGAALMVVSVALQGRGHKQEEVPPEPFSSPFNAVSRIFVEQWVTFPRYVLSGGWRDALRHG